MLALELLETRSLLEEGKQGRLVPRLGRTLLEVSSCDKVPVDGIEPGAPQGLKGCCPVPRLSSQQLRSGSETDISSRPEPARDAPDISRLAHLCAVRERRSDSVSSLSAVRAVTLAQQGSQASIQREGLEVH